MLLILLCCLIYQNAPWAVYKNATLKGFFAMSSVFILLRVVFMFFWKTILEISAKLQKARGKTIISSQKVLNANIFPRITFTVETNSGLISLAVWGVQEKLDYVMMHTSFFYAWLAWYKMLPGHSVATLFVVAVRNCYVFARKNLTISFYLRDLSYNKGLTGPIPVWIGNLKKLTNL